MLHAPWSKYTCVAVPVVSLIIKSQYFFKYMTALSFLLMSHTAISGRCTSVILNLLVVSMVPGNSPFGAQLMTAQESTLISTFSQSPLAMLLTTFTGCLSSTPHISTCCCCRWMYLHSHPVEQHWFGGRPTSHQWILSSISDLGAASIPITQACPGAPYGRREDQGGPRR